MRNTAPPTRQLQTLQRAERPGGRTSQQDGLAPTGWRLIRAVMLVLMLTLSLATPTLAGPVILGGDDLTDHGSINGAGELQQGWLYIRKALENLSPHVTLPGNDGSVAALGAGPSTATSANAGAAIGAAAAAAGLSVSYYDGATEMGQFLSDLATGTTTPAIIWLAGTDTVNDLDNNEGAVLTANAPLLANFVNAGGGLMAHGSGPVAYGWLEALLPGLEEVNGCQSLGAVLTPTGQAAFPGLSNSDIDNTAGPCHSHFEGELGALEILAFDGDGLNFIIGSQNASLPTLLLTPPFAVSLPDTTHTVTATVTDPAPPFAPLPGIEVTFRVTAGPNIGKTGLRTTDANGQASFTYTGDTGIGRDKISAVINDPQTGIRSSNPVTMSWTIRCDIDGDQVVDSDDLQAIFTARNTPATLADLHDTDTDGTITVNDGRACAALCSKPQCAPDTPPVAHAGPNQTVNTGDPVSLNGSTSADAEDDPLTFSWAFSSQPTGSSATLSGPTTVNPTFTADVAGSYVIQLIVNDGATNSDPDTVEIQAQAVQVTVPDVVGQPRTDAEAALVAANLIVGSIAQVFDATVPADNVISQDPAAGTAADAGTAVNLVVSLGDQPIPVPDVVGLPQATAEANILAAGLTVGTLSLVNDNVVPSGTVISQTPAGGSSAPPGSAVDLVISTGPPPVTVPDMVGLQQVDAEAALVVTGLTVGIVTQASSATVPFGEIISQNPTAGSSVPGGTGVDLVVSLGNLPGGDLIRPAVQISVVPAVANLGDTVTMSVTALDSGGISTTTLLVDGTPVPLDGSGMATFSSPTPGVFTVEVTALDPDGNAGFASTEFRVLTTGDGVLPTVEITAPADGAELTLPTDIIGTVSDETAVLRYVIDASLAGQDEFFRVTSGTTPVTNGTLGQFDPTLLRNGIYDVRLTVEDTSGNIASAIRTYEVDGGAKIGNFSISFEDLTIPVSGIPITITRTYDSRNRATGDFGAGWTLDIKDVELYESVTLGTEWEQTASGGIFPTYTLEPTRPHFVVVRFPYGRVETFDLVVNPESQQLVPLTFTNASFQADPTTISSLLSLDNTNNLLFSNGGGVGPLTLLNPDASLYDPDRYQLTDTNGTVYIIQQPTGLESITARNGNTVTFGPEGIIHSTGKSVTFTRDSQGRITTITDPLGNTLRYTYDFYGDLVSMIDQEGNVTLFTYNANHGLLDIIDPRGVQVSRNEYGDDGRVIATTDADGSRTEFTHDIAARREEILDRLGNTTVYEYDERGNLTATISPRGHRTEFTYDERNNRLTVKDPFNKITTFAYDENDNLKTRIDPLGNTESFTYNGFNQLLTRTDARGGVTTFAYDANGKRTSAKYPEDNEFTFTYDAAGNPQKIIDPTLAETTLAYDPFGNLIQGTNQLQGTTTFGYDANGKLTSLTPPGRPAHTSAYTPTGLEQTYTPPTLGPQPPVVSTTFDYDPALNLMRITRPDGLTVEFAHDSANRVLTTTFPPPASFPPGDRAVSLTYDAAGQILTATAPDTGVVTHTYDTSLLATSTWTGTIAGSVERTYDALDRLATQSVNGGQSVTFTYDDGGFLTGAGALALGRTPQGGLLANTTLGVVSDAPTYDGNKNVLTYQATAGVAVLLDQQYTRDALGRVSQKVETMDGTTTTFGYIYDATGQLTQVTQDGSIVTTYTYDPNGNREQQDGPGGVVTGTYDTQDRLLSWGNATYTYTANGELSSKTVGSQTTTYAYDVLGDLLTVTLPDTTQIEYIVDGENHRIGKIVNGTLVQGFLYQDELNPVAELDASGTVIAQFVYSSREHVPDYMIKGGTTYRLISDLLGSVRLVVDTTTGVIAQRLDYDAFGQVLLDTNPGFQPFGFAGGLYDQDTKLTRFGARDYEAETGRWTAKDPIRFEGKDTNLYGYVQNDPINFYDPTGNISSSEHFATLPIAGTLSRLAVSSVAALNQLHHAAPKQILEHLFRTVGNTSYLRFLKGIRGFPNRIRICVAFHDFLHYRFVRHTAGGVRATGVNPYLLGVIWEASAQGITGLALVQTVANATLLFTENAAAAFMLGGGMAQCP